MRICSPAEPRAAGARSGACGSPLRRAVAPWLIALAACDSPPTDVPRDPPAFTVAEPAADVAVGLAAGGGSVRIRGTAAGQAPLSVAWSVDDGPERVMPLGSAGTAQLDFPIDSLTPGSHTLSLAVRDRDGRASDPVLRRVLVVPVVREVPPLPGASSMVPSCIGPTGDAVGYWIAGDPARWSAWRLSAGTVADLSTPGEFRSAASGLNAAGDVVGYSVATEGSAPRARLWRGATPLSPIQAPGVARAINDRGDVVGVAELPGEATPVGFVLRSGGVSYIRGAAGELYSPAAIDGTGRVAGTVFRPDGTARAFLLDASGNRLLPTLGGERAYARAMNGQGAIVGYSDVRERVAYHAFLYQDGTIRDLTPPDPAVLSAYAYGVNEEGVVVGELVVADGEGTASTGFVYYDGQLRRLEDVTGPDYQVTSGYDVNDRGEIIAGAIHRRDPAAVVRTLVIVPPGGLRAFFASPLAPASATARDRPAP